MRPREFSEVELLEAARDSNKLSLLIADVLVGNYGHTDLVALVYAFAEQLAIADKRTQHESIGAIKTVRGPKT